LHDNEELAKSFGRDVRAVRRSALLIAALMATAAGVLQAAYVGYVHPVSFSSMESTLLLAIVIIGGVGSFWGPVIGAFILTLLPELLRFLGLPVAQAANIRQIILGLVLVAVVFQMRVMNRRGLFHDAGATR
jgi:branched-chain amino acid transport system permease protein